MFVWFDKFPPSHKATEETCRTIRTPLKEVGMNIYPSLMIVPESDLKKEIKLLAPYCKGFHLDVMDGLFVGNQHWNDVVKVNTILQLMESVWLHLMVENPAAFYNQLFLPVQSLISFHIESHVDIFSFIKRIKEKNNKASIAIRPKTSLSKVIPFLHVIDQVLVMSVEPGFSGQSFLEGTFDKISELAAYRKKHAMQFAIGVDGGINKNNSKQLALQGVDDCAIAFGIFGSKDHLEALRDFKRMC